MEGIKDFYGIIDGVKVRFNFTPPNIWEFDLPKKQNGMYMVQLFIESKSGIINTYTDLFVTVKYNELGVEVIMPEFSTKLLKEVVDTK